MTTASHANGAKANGHVRPTRTDVRPDEVMQKLQAIFATAPQLAMHAGYSKRAAQYVFSGRNGLSLTAFLRILRTQAGPAVLDALLGDIEWWERQRAQQRIADLEAELAELKSKRR